MRVIHLSHSDINGGAARAAYRIHLSLLKKGFNSHMWVNKASSGHFTIKQLTSKIDKVINELRPRLINYSLVKMLNTKNKVIHSPSVISSKWVKLINNSDADIVHLHWIQQEMLSINDISKIKKPIVWTLHDMWAFCGAEHLTEDNRWRYGYHHNNRPSYETGFDLNRWTWQRKKKYWKTPLQIVTPSKWLANCVQESNLMSDWPVSIIPNPINIKCWRPLNKKIAREQLNLPQNVPLILFGATSPTEDPNKGYDLLLSSLEYLKKNSKIKEFQLVVFGQSRSNSKLSLGYPIHFMGQLYDDISLRVLYSAADVVVVPSRQEAFGQTASEAHACGTPVVSFYIGGLIDIIEHKKTGYLAKPFDTVDFAKGISWVLDKKNKKLLEEQARVRAVEKFSQQVVIKQYQTVYEKVLNNKNET